MKSIEAISMVANVAFAVGCGLAWGPLGGAAVYASTALAALCLASVQA